MSRQNTALISAATIPSHTCRATRGQRRAVSSCAAISRPGTTVRYPAMQRSIGRPCRGTVSQSGHPGAMRSAYTPMKTGFCTMNSAVSTTKTSMNFTIAFFTEI